MNTIAGWQRSLVEAIEADAESARLAEQGLAYASEDALEEGLAIYRNNSLGSRALALESVYPVCLRLIGSESFRGLAREFARRHPSTHPDLNLYGDGFSVLLDEVVRTYAEFDRLPWLADLARLEWLCHRVYYQADDAPLDLSQLQGSDAHGLCPRPSSCLAWLRTSWPVHEIWLTHQNDADPPAMQVEEGDWYLVVERKNYRVEPVISDSGTLDLLDACASGATLGEIADDPRLDAEGLGELVLRGWIGRLE